jgi:multiple sugar transport system permease protein
LARIDADARRARGATAPRRLTRAQKENLAGYLFLLPWLCGLFLLTAGPLLASLYLSFTRYDFFDTPKWVGLDNYATLFGDDPRYLHATGVTVQYVLVSVPLQLAFALLMALLLNRGLRGLSFYRAVYYLPSLLGGSVAIAIMWRQVFGSEGLLNQVLALVGVEGRSWIANPEYALYTLVLLRVWQFGSPMVIFLAGLKQIPQELYDAAAVDGAGLLSQFRGITIPLLTPLIFFNLILQMIGAFQAFTPAFIVSNGSGGPVDSTLFYTLYLYQQVFTSFKMGYGSAMAWVLLVILASATAFAFRTSRYWVHYEDQSR